MKKKVELINQYLLKVQVFATSRIDERSGVSQKTGKDWYIRNQEAYIDLGGQFPVMVKIPVPTIAPIPNKIKSHTFK